MGNKQRKELREEVVQPQLTEPNKKILLLGCGESGKSTIYKQFYKAIGSHSQLLSNSQRIEFFIQIGLQLWKLIEIDPIVSDELKPVMQKLKLPDESSHDSDLYVKTLTLENWRELATAINSAKSKTTSTVFPNHTNYFLKNWERMCKEFTPTDNLRLYTRTTGIVEGSMSKLTVMDVGGTRSERKKWIHTFENVYGVVFCVNAAHFDMTLWEDSSQNCLEENTTLFTEIFQSRWFHETRMILLVTNIDRLTEKLECGVSYSDFQKTYTGPNKPNEVLRDQIAKYTNRVKNTLTKKNLDIVLLPSTMDNVAINCMLELLMDSKDVPKPTQPLPGSFAASLPEKAVIWNLLGFIN